MAATLELKYFNSFWIKKLDTIVDVTDGFARFDSISNLDITLTGAIGQPAVGQVLQNTEPGGQPFENKVYITAVNGNILGTSEMYENKALMENGIDSVKKNAPRSKL